MKLPKRGDTVLMWCGVITATGYPVPAQEKDDPAKWVEAEVIECGRHLPSDGSRPSLYLISLAMGSPVWVPPGGWKLMPEEAHTPERS